MNATAHAAPSAFTLATRAHDARLAARKALLAVADALPARPEPRSKWDDLQREDTFARVAIIDADVGMCRRALQMAASLGPDKLHQVRGLVVAYFAAKTRATLVGFELDEAFDAAPVLAAHIARELGEAVAATVQFAARPTPANGHTARLEVAEALDASDRALRCLTAAIGR